MSFNRFSVKFGGESGQGINSVGEIFAKTLAETNYNIFAYREYPSLIKGGVASYQIDFSNKKVNSSQRGCNVLISLTQESFNSYLPSLEERGIVIHNLENLEISEEQEETIKEKDLHIVKIDTATIIKEIGATVIMSNMILLGFLWKVLGFESDTLVKVVLDYFSEKKLDLNILQNAILAGYDSPSFRPELSKSIDIPQKPLLKKPKYIISGNESIALGAIGCGVRAYYAYPMTPATSIFKFLGDTATETGILVKQAENEITAVQMALGSMYMGTRAMVGTSGGGFDLMLETVSCSGMSETPLVLVASQRIGAGTGVPTWTGAGDLNSAIKGGHGEFPRCVLALSDAKSSYTLTQEAFNIAERYQIPVIILTEKQISESHFCIEELPKNIKIDRYLNNNENRYTITEDGISERWIPEKGVKPYISTSDEHDEKGTSTEDPQIIMEMQEKRIRKLQTLTKDLPEPTLYGKESSKTIFVGWGSVKNPILDVIEARIDIAYLHYDYIYPLKTDLLEKLISKDKQLIIVENNMTGQLASLIKETIGYEFENRMLKYDARPIFTNNILDFLKEI